MAISTKHIPTKTWKTGALRVEREDEDDVELELEVSWAPVGVAVESLGFPLGMKNEYGI
jgi:hypothetical protein